jgi:hypothetical protein
LRQLAITQPEDVHWFALVDRAFDHGSPKQVPAPTVTPLYRRIDLESLLEVSPVLIPLEVGPMARFGSQLDALLEHCAGRPMLSFIASTGDAEDIAKAWEDLHFVHTDDNQRFLLRFADTRTLYDLPWCLTPEHWAALHKIITCWIAPDRRGWLQQLPLSKAKPKAPRQLTTETLSRLTKSSFGDAVFSHWDVKKPELLPTENRAYFWGIVQTACNQADEDIGFGDLLALCQTAMEAKNIGGVKA